MDSELTLHYWWMLCHDAIFAYYTRVSFLFGRRSLLIWPSVYVTPCSNAGYAVEQTDGNTRIS